MPPQPPRTGIEMSFTFAKPDRRVRMDPDEPFRILVLGDFSGRTTRASDRAAKLRPRPVDLADVDATLAALSPAPTT